MIVRDAAEMLPMAVDSAWQIADEIVLGVDDRTTDDTAAIARRMGCRVHHFAWQDSFAAARNIGLAKARKDWILALDADNRLTAWGAATIREVMRKPANVDAYAFNIAEYDLDGRRVEVSMCVPRLFQNDRRMRYFGYVHEVPRKSGKAIVWGRLQGGIVFQHIGSARELYERHGKDERNMRLLLKQMRDYPSDPFAPYYLARQHAAMGRHVEALTAAHATLRIYRDKLSDEEIAHMDAIVEGRAPPGRVA